MSVCYCCTDTCTKLHENSSSAWSEIYLHWFRPNCNSEQIIMKQKYVMNDEHRECGYKFSWPYWYDRYNVVCIQLNERSVFIAVLAAVACTSTLFFSFVFHQQSQLYVYSCLHSQVSNCAPVFDENRSICIVAVIKLYLLSFSPSLSYIFLFYLHSENVHLL